MKFTLVALLFSVSLTQVVALAQDTKENTEKPSIVIPNETEAPPTKVETVSTPPEVILPEPVSELPVISEFEARKLKLGLLAGVSLPSYASTNSRLLWGGNFDFRWNPQAPLSLGFFASKAKGGGRSPGLGKFDFDYLTYGADLKFHFKTRADRDLYIGLLASALKLEVRDLTRPKNRFSPYAFGALVGIDFRMRTNFSFGLEFQSLAVTTAKDKYSTDRNDPFSIFNLFITSKLWVF